MPNGRVHDHPVTDTIVHGLHPYPPDLEELVIQVHARDPGVFNDLVDAPFDWEQGRFLAEARALLTGLILEHGDPSARRRLLRAYADATRGG